MTKPRRIVQLDLGDDLSELATDERGLFVVVWWRQVPLGQLTIEPEELPLRVPELANRIARAIVPAVGDRLFQEGFHAPLPSHRRTSAPRGEPVDLGRLLGAERPLNELVERSGNGVRLRGPTQATREGSAVSVIVCTRDRPRALRRCLSSLTKLSPAALETIVVDNASRDDETREVVRGFPGLRYVREPRAGLDVARNAGAQASAGDIVAFTDDDVEVHPGWIRALRAAFDDANVMAVTGLVLPAELDTEAQWIFETRWGFNRGYRARLFDRAWFEREVARGIPVDQIGAGANMAFRREILSHVGGFDERLDVGAAGCSGDSEFWYRVLAAGFSCRYEPSAVVFHHHRRTIEDLRRQIFYYMRGHAAALLTQFERHGHRGNLRRLLVALPCHYVKALARSLLTPKKAHTLWAEIAGHLSGMCFYWAHRSTVGGSQCDAGGGHSSKLPWSHCRALVEDPAARRPPSASSLPWRR
jgi:GT2 family glycosyltransferase